MLAGNIDCYECQGGSEKNIRRDRTDIPIPHHTAHGVQDRNLPQKRLEAKNVATFRPHPYTCDIVFYPKHLPFILLTCQRNCQQSKEILLQENTGEAASLRY